MHEQIIENGLTQKELGDDDKIYGGNPLAVDLKGKTCVVTGAARSIGLAIAEMYCGLGANVAMIDLNAQVEDHAKRLKEARCNVRGYVLDVTDRVAVLECFKEIEKTLGSVFALVNTAGAADQQLFTEITPDRLDRMSRVNINGAVWCSQAALKSMTSYRDGRIINFSSKSGKTGSAIMGAYSASKGAIIALTQSMAFELAKLNIKVNCLCPGPVEDSVMWASVNNAYKTNLGLNDDEIARQFTAKVPLGRLCRIADVVSFVKFLTTEADYCTGQAYNLTGGREVH